MEELEMTKNVITEDHRNRPLTIMFALCPSTLPALILSSLARSRHMNQSALIKFSPGDLKLRFKNCKSIFLHGSKFESCRATVFCHMGIETKLIFYNRKSLCREREGSYRQYSLSLWQLSIY